MELAVVGRFECEAGGVGSWGTSVGVGYDSTGDLRNDSSGGIREDRDCGGGEFSPGETSGRCSLFVECRNMMFLVLSLGIVKSVDGPSGGLGGM